MSALDGFILVLAGVSLAWSAWTHVRIRRGAREDRERWREEHRRAMARLDRKERRP